MTYSDAEQYWIWLSAVPGMTPRRFYALLSKVGDARAVWDTPDIARTLLDDKAYLSLLSARRRRFLHQQL